MNYYKMFSKDMIKQETIDAVREIIKAGLFREKNIELKKPFITKLNKDLCLIYNFSETKITYQENFYGTGGYCPSKDDIILNKPSLVTFLHEFYHRLAHKNSLNNSEDNARGWSISAYYLAAPNLCVDAINRGLIMFQDRVEVNV